METIVKAIRAVVAVLVLALGSAAAAAAADPAVSTSRFVLTAPAGAEAGARARGDAASAARAHLADVGGLHGIGADDVGAARVTRVHDTGRGAIVVTFREEIAGIEVFGEGASILMNRDFERLAVSGFLGGARSRVPSVVASGFALDPADGAAAAIVAATDDRALAAEDLRAIGATDGPYVLYDFRPGAAGLAATAVTQPSRLKRVYVRDGETYRAAYYVEVAAGGELVAYVVAADDGTVLSRTSLTAHAAFVYRGWFQTTGDKEPYEGPVADFTPHPVGSPVGISAPFVAPVLVSIENGPIPTGDDWLAFDAVETLGNNVDAYTDAVAPDGFSAGDFRAATTSAATFNHVYDTMAEPSSSATQTQAAIVQAFYNANFEHDVWYEAGFDEAAGNAQADNYGRGGIAGDRLLVEVQDHALANASTMTTPADGGSPRMQLSIWTAPPFGVAREGALDNQLVAHEWAHLMTSRLIGDGSGLTTNQAKGLAEGWSDFSALLMTVKEGDDFGGTYAIGGYAGAGQSSDAAYYGVRRLPYSTQLAKNPLTFKHIENGVAIAGASCDFDCDGSNNADVHNTGEVWATMLWEAYAGLLQDTLGPTPRLDFAEARRRMREYLVAALKVTPLDPTFTEARDALLAVAAAGDPSDAEIFCGAFAARGLGTDAVAPARTSTTNAGVVESFTCASPTATCAPAPRNDCGTPAKGQVKFQGNADPAKQQLQWKWSGGTAAIEDFGDPVTGATNYRLCVYDDGALRTNAALAAGGNCGTKPCWSAKPTSLAWKLKAGNADGLTQVQLKAGTGKAQIQIKGKGAGLQLPFPFVDTTSVTVQLVQDGASGGACWSSEFAAPALKYDAVKLKFQDKLP